MAFGLKRSELIKWKQEVRQGKIAFLTHYWMDERFPDCYTVTKVGCSDIEKLIQWGTTYGLKKSYIHFKGDYPHYDLFGRVQKHILMMERKFDHIKKYNL
ncbi:hypothetical protein ACLIBH_12950 [Virgibacillus sp. W0430]|uniref:hypothetical protein n=1 Tax=Virgibacillus sp. W0430 TaxID=3391580 RepID=UPI003F47028E